MNLYSDRGDDITTGNIVGDAKDEVIVASTRFKLIIVYSATGEELRRLSNKGFEDGDRVLAGDFLPGRPHDEIAIISNEDEGRIDIFNGDAEHLVTRHSAYDGDGDDVAAGDVTGDFAEDVVVANDEEGRIDRVQIVSNTADDRDTAYDDDDRLGVGDMTGDGIAEVVIANTESNRIDVINYHGAGGNMPSAYDGNDRFAVGTFGSGDLDGDSIPDRVELLGVRDDKGELLIDLEKRGASPCRKDVVVDIARMQGIDPLEEALDNVVVTIAAADGGRAGRELPVHRREQGHGHEPDHPRDRPGADAGDPAPGDDQRRGHGRHADRVDVRAQGLRSSAVCCGPTTTRSRSRTRTPATWSRAPPRARPGTASTSSTWSSRSTTTPIPTASRSTAPRGCRCRSRRSCTSSGTRSGSATAAASTSTASRTT